jgi:hypothetical protein
LQRLPTVRCVVEPRLIAKKRLETASSITGGGVANERFKTGSRVVVANCVETEGPSPMAVLLLAIVLWLSAARPMAVLWSPIVLNKRAPPPSAVL